MILPTLRGSAVYGCRGTKLFVLTHDGSSGVIIINPELRPGCAMRKRNPLYLRSAGRPLSEMLQFGHRYGQEVETIAVLSVKIARRDYQILIRKDSGIIGG